MSSPYIAPSCRHHLVASRDARFDFCSASPLKNVSIQSEPAAAPASAWTPCLYIHQQYPDDYVPDCFLQHLITHRKTHLTLRLPPSWVTHRLLYPRVSTSFHPPHIHACPLPLGRAYHPDRLSLILAASVILQQISLVILFLVRTAWNERRKVETGQEPPGT